jgi:hypothetical protein
MKKLTLNFDCIKPKMLDTQRMNYKEGNRVCYSSF